VRNPECGTADAGQAPGPVGRVRLTDITADPADQPRERPLDPDHAAEIAAWLREDPAHDTPPVDLFRLPGGSLRLAHGNHRVEAYRRAGRADVPAVVHAGDAAAVRLFASGTNKDNVTLRRTAADKRRAVRMALEAAPDWSSRRIAEHVGVAHTLVNQVRAELEAAAGTDAPPPAERLGRDGRPARIAPRPPRPGAGDRGRVPTDATGYPVPPHLRDVFSDPRLGDLLDRLKTVLDGAGEVYERLAREPFLKAYPFCEVGPAAEALADLVRPGTGRLHQVIGWLVAGRPYAVCRRCRGESPDCPDCRGGGHLPARRYAELTPPVEAA